MSRFNLLFCLLAAFPAVGAPWASTRPKLTVFIVIDQFRADYISRYQSEFSKDGFLALINNGAYFPYGEYDILQSMTAPGHATVLTGAYPYQMGIPLNDWYDQKSHAVMYNTEDPDYDIVGSTSRARRGGTSPRNLIATTVGDELKNADIPTRVTSLALKDRAAILMGGHRPDVALWFDHEKRRWVSSTYYLKDGALPSWVDALNKISQADLDCNYASPCGIDTTVTAFKAALDENYRIPGKGRSDLIAVSFSAHDFVGHAHGPNSPEIKAMTLAEDKALAQMRKLVAAKVPGGLKNVLFVLTGDHGVSPTGDYLKNTGIDAGTVDEATLTKQMNEQLNKVFGQPSGRPWIAFAIDLNFYLDEDVVASMKADMRKVQDEVKAVLLRHPAILHAFTQADVEMRRLPPGQFERQILKTYFPTRSGHVVGIQKPFYVTSSKNIANHMTGYTYDRMVPIILSGFGIRGGLYADKAEVIDIAPTLSFLLGVVPPSLSEGKVLKMALKSQAAAR